MTNAGSRTQGLALLLVLAVAACQTPRGTLFRTTVTSPDGSYPMAVVLGDATGLVTAIESARGESARELPSVRPDPDDPNSVIVSWGTGACDDETAVSMQRSGGGFRMGITVNAGFSLGCTAQLVFRGLRVTFSEPVPADSIQVSGGL